MVKDRLISFIRKYHVLLIVSILLFSYSFSIKTLIRGNEVDVLPVAKQFMNHNWLPDDWYLNLDTGYRILFNFIAGSMALIMPLWLVGLIGRIIVSLLFSYFIFKFSRIFRINIAILLLILFIWHQFFDTLIAKEWILKGFDTKSFAYVFAFFALYSLIKKQYFRMFLFSGLSLSFHMLIGVYGAFCLAASALINYRYDTADIKKYLKSFFIFFISGGLGIYAILKTLFENQNINKKFASLIYVYYRVPHHVLPSVWPGILWIIMFAVIVIFLIAVYVFNKNKSFRITAVYAAASAALFITGLLIFKFNKPELLKYYWFRYPDVVMPFFFIFLAGSVLQRMIRIAFVKFRNIKYFNSVIRALPVYITALIFMFFSAKDMFYFFKYRIDKKDIVIKQIDDRDLYDVMAWIKKNTPANSIVLADPFEDDKYIFMERAVFVSFKHSPQSEKDIIEWYKRLKLCYEDFRTEFKEKNDFSIQGGFYSLKTETLNKIADGYNVRYYIGLPDKNYPFTIVYKNDKYAVYNLK